MVFTDEVGELVKSDGVYMNSEWRGESGNFMLGAGFDPAESESLFYACDLFWDHGDGLGGLSVFIRDFPFDSMFTV